MINSLRSIHLKPHQLLVIIPAAVLVWEIRQDVFHQRSLENVLLWIALLMLYTVSTSFAGDVKNGLWTGYISFAVIVSAFVTGLMPVLVIIFLGTAIALLWNHFMHKLSTPFHLGLGEYLDRVIIGALGAIVTFSMFYFLGGVLPLKDFSRAEDWFAIIGTALVVYPFWYLLGAWITRKNGEELRAIVNKSVGMDLLLYSVAVIMPAIRENNGNGVMVVLVGLVLLQAVRYRQISDARSLIEVRSKEIATLYQDSQRLGGNLSIINRSVQDVMFNLDRQSAIDVACEVACFVTGASKAAVFFVTDRLHLRPMATHNITLPPDMSFTYYPERYTNGAHIVKDINLTDDAQLKKLAIASTFRATLETPLKTGNVVVGYIAVYHEEPHQYEQNDINLLEMLSSQLTAAFDNADLLQALELYASEQAQLVQISRMTTSHLDLDLVIADVCFVMPNMVQMEVAQIGILGGATHGSLEIYYQNPLNNQLTTKNLLISDYVELNNLIENPLTANPCILSLDDDSLSDEVRLWMEQEGWQTMAITPLTIMRQSYGVVILGSSEPVTFLDNHRRLLEMATNQVSAQIHNARIHHITEISLAQQLEQLALIENIAQKVSQSLELDLIIANVMDAALQATQADTVEIALRDEARWQLITLARQPDETAVTVFQDEPDPIIQKVAKERHLVMDGNHDGRNSFLAVPLLSGGEVVGVLKLASEKPNFFTGEHASFTQSLAGHAAISIDNAHLLGERQEQINTLTALRTLTLESVGTLSHEFVSLAILKATLTLLGGEEAVLFGYDVRTDELVIHMGAALQAGNVIQRIPSFPPQTVLEAVRYGKVQVVHRPRQTNEQGEKSFGTLLLIPIVRQGTIRDIVVLGYTRYARFTEREMNTIELLSAQVAGHLDNVMLNQAIQESNERLRVILDSTRDGIILLDNGGRVQDANIAASSMLQTDLNKHLNENFKRLMQHYYSNGENDAENGMVQIGNFSTVDSVPNEQEFALHYRGAVDHVRALILPVRDRDGMGVGRLLLLRDITEEQTLINTRESLQRMVIHDLRSPLGAIISSLAFMQILIEDFPENQTVDIRKTVSISLESSNTLMRLMDTLRDLPRLKDREMHLQQQMISMRLLAQKAYDMLGASFKEANINMEIRVPNEAQVYVDVDLVRRVLINLLHNAFKFTPENGTILIVAETLPDDMMRVLVCDSGPGIPEDKRELIFEEFKQVEGQIPARGGRGTGLGLTFCKLAIEAHGGYITVEANSLLDGACFAFTLPTTSAK